MILDEIVASTIMRVKKLKLQKSFDILKKEVLSLNMSRRMKINNEMKPSRVFVEEDMCCHKFEKALSKSNISFICEIKKSSPSKGLISKNFKYKEIALEYEKAGADAISVITEPNFFLGNIKYLEEIKDIVKVPILRKDFIIDFYQIYESKIIGADAILLICSILSHDFLKLFIELAEELGIASLVEVCNAREVEIALKADAKIIGVNNRNLKTFEVDFNNTIKLRKLVPSDKIFVSESGIKTKEQMDILKSINVDAVLIGEELMRNENNISTKLQDLKSEI
jgi:indole-3-glycerol phosphate synthase